MPPRKAVALELNSKRNKLQRGHGSEPGLRQVPFNVLNNAIDAARENSMVRIESKISDSDVPSQARGVVHSKFSRWRRRAVAVGKRCRMSCFFKPRQIALTSGGWRA